MKIYHNFMELVGHTPLVQINNYSKLHNIKTNLLVKLEYFNPAGSAKDRIAKAIIEDAENRSILKPNSTIIEPTSGNTGIGLCAVAASKGYKIIITMPDSFIPGQFTNLVNRQAHYMTTGPEIWQDTDGKIDIFVAGIGTGGTLSGTGKYLKEQNPNIKIIGIEPQTSAVLTTGKAGAHKIQGIGAGFIPDTLDTSIYDEIITVDNEVCFTASKELTKTEGLLTGISSGAALWAATQVAKRPENVGKNIVVLLPDTGERYLSTPLFEE